MLDLWREVDVDTMRLEPDPLLSTPERALALWRKPSRTGTPFAPPLRVGYEIHDCNSVELELGDVDGGALVECALWRVEVAGDDPTPAEPARALGVRFVGVHGGQVRARRPEVDWLSSADWAPGSRLGANRDRGTPATKRSHDA